MNKSVFIMTHRRGFEADPVIDELRRRNVNVFRFNTDAGDEASLTSFTSEGEVEFSCDGKKITSFGIAVGWCQQLPPYLGQASTEHECLQRENLLALQLSVSDVLHNPWFNKPSRVLFASNKINQLKVAQSVGLAIPRTLVSNNPATIRNFANKRVVIAKNLATPWIVRSDKETRAAYTRIVDPAWLLDDEALSFTPVIYQEYCERKKDIRVVVVGDRIFSASCIPGPQQREDVRKESSTGESYGLCEFEEGTLNKLIKLMHIFGLDYCAADFMEDVSGDLFFLEVNTCGAWWWIDRLYGGAICLALTDALQSRMGGLV